MELSDTHSCEELVTILNSYKEIASLLADALDVNMKIKMKVYRLIAEKDISIKLSEHNQLIELIRNGGGDLVEEYYESEKEVTKLKNACKYAEHALNTKKHINNLGRE
jgi:hypothetical protein